jgi:hypothetical protein
MCNRHTISVRMNWCRSMTTSYARKLRHVIAYALRRGYGRILSGAKPPIFRYRRRRDTRSSSISGPRGRPASTCRAVCSPVLRPGFETPG